ncbi:hypothetical protein FJ959_18080 [Mesorhizobium sp. B2-2-4]|uniref:hypothetical protein n=1 Tax=unclassified Mesorhizobium TaxID=325217 RepID=UPI00112E1B6F|nr:MULTISPECIES: hypothetical protein [unclassified Mesorhizobium]TPM55320.1 hypothetical protein FJ959_18080 [Mesorhizobium sp. B2-2-4]TPM66287.1 hypothetical protein FJ965_14040 [Mesorhizobium sp. B2-2-1]TPN59932.1 hypothetical protein FJ984_30955 [Mesorhizobium sp. B1-1-3]
MSTLADRLIAAAAMSPETEAWISRQLMAGQRPSQILAAIETANVVSFAPEGVKPAGDNDNRQLAGMVERACNALAAIDLRLALAAAFTFGMTVACLAVGVH